MNLAQNWIRRSELPFEASVRNSIMSLKKGWDY
jgi:hypothetical protein